LLCFLALVAFTHAWKNLPCRTGTCPVQITQMAFQDPKTAHLTIGFDNKGNEEYKEGTLRIYTQGHGCVLFFCSWADGPLLNNATCDWGICTDGVFLHPGEKKSADINFHDALATAHRTSGCCSPSNDCDGCIIKGEATWFSSSGAEIAKVEMGFFCTLSTRNGCRVTARPEPLLIEDN